jgi:hypothetical protein
MAAAAIAANKAIHKHQIKVPNQFRALENSIKGLHRSDEVEQSKSFKDVVVRKTLNKIGKVAYNTDEDFTALPRAVDKSREKEGAGDLFLEEMILKMSDPYPKVAHDAGPWMPATAILGRERIFFTATCANQEGQEISVVIEDCPLLLIDWIGSGVISNEPDEKVRWWAKVISDFNGVAADGHKSGDEGVPSHGLLFRAYAGCKELCTYFGLLEGQHQISDGIEVCEPPTFQTRAPPSASLGDEYLQLFVSCKGMPAPNSS